MPEPVTCRLDHIPDEEKERRDQEDPIAQRQPFAQTGRIFGFAGGRKRSHTFSMPVGGGALQVEGCRWKVAGGKLKVVCPKWSRRLQTGVCYSKCVVTHWRKCPNPFQRVCHNRRRIDSAATR